MAKNIENAHTTARERSNLLTGELFRYGIAGLINTLVGFIVYSAAIKILNSPFWLANLFAIFAGIACGYTLARIFVFENLTPGKHTNAWKYVVTLLLQYAISTLLIGLLIHRGFSEIMSYILILPAAIAVSFILQKFWVFGSESKGIRHEL